MKFIEDVGNGHNTIRSFEDGVVLISESSYDNSIIVSGNRIIEHWPPEVFSEINEAHLEVLLGLEPEIVLLGTGPEIHFLSPEHSMLFLKNNIGLESMNTAAACRTYNVLVSEGRNVVAALLVK